MNKIAVCVPTHNEEPMVTRIVMAKIRKAIGVDGQISVYNDAEGRGKGFALREALKQAPESNYYVFIDGDGDIDPIQIRDIIRPLYLSECDIVVGKKALPIRWDRKILTFASRIWIKLLFGLTVDSQTGIKGFNYRPEGETNGWGFDLEVLYKAKKMGKTMAQVPIHAVVSSSKSFWDIWSTFIDSIKIRIKYAKYEGKK